MTAGMIILLYIVDTLPYQKISVLYFIINNFYESLNSCHLSSIRISVYFSSIHACLLVKALLRNYINQEKCPSELYKNTTDSVGAIANMTASLACKFNAQKDVVHVTRG